MEVREGAVALRGPMLAGEVKPVLASIAAVRGVNSVVNELEWHESAEGVPSLQGEGRIPGLRPDILQRNWAPHARSSERLSRPPAFS